MSLHLNLVLLLELAHFLLHERVELLLVTLPLKQVLLFAGLLKKSIMLPLCLALIDSFALLDQLPLLLLLILVHPKVLSLLIKLVLDAHDPLVLDLTQLFTALSKALLLILSHKVKTMLVQLVLVPGSFSLVLDRALFLLLTLSLA